MRAQMRAVGLRQPRFTGLGSVEDQLLTKVFHGQDLTGANLIGGGNGEPSKGNPRKSIALDQVILLSRGQTTPNS